MKELHEIYPAIASGDDPKLPPPSNNYAAFVQRQHDLISGEAGAKLSRHWQAEVRDVDHVLELPTDFVRPDRFTSRAATVPISIQAPIADRLRHLAKVRSVTVNAVLLSGLSVLLSRFARQRRFLIGSPFSGRSENRFESTVGYFSGVLPLRMEVDDRQSFGELVDQTSATLIRALDHEAYPLSQIVRDINPPRDNRRAPLIQTLCTFENSHDSHEAGRASFLMPQQHRSANVGGILQETFAVPHPTCHYDLEFTFDTGGPTIHGMVGYCVDLFRGATIRSLADRFVELVDRLSENPAKPIGEVSWPDDVVHRGWGHVSDQSIANASKLSDRLVQAFDEHSSLPVASTEQADWSFADLDRQSDRVSHALVTRDESETCLVPVIGPPGYQVLQAILGVLRSGSAVVPIDSNQPSISTKDLLNQTSAATLLVHNDCEFDGDGRDVDVMTFGSSDNPKTQDATSDEPLEGESDAKNGRRAAGPRDTAYVIYTSGTTGQPKGVVVTHQAIGNTLDWRRRAVPIRPGDKVLMLLSHQFDAGFGLMLSTILQGGCLVWPRPATDGVEIDHLIDVVIRKEVTVLPGTPSLLRLFIDHPRFEECRSLQQIWSGGEAMPRDLPSKVHRRSNAEIWNFYGPTEAAVETAALKLPRGHDVRAPVAIGRPIDGMNVMIVDPFHRPLPAGFPGQMAITGIGLAEGYLGDDDLTARRFVNIDDGTRGATATGMRYYLTGDIGRITADDQLEFLGREDG
ncbi:MAG: AMP-binding protein, partial [Planctomycetota bacterium]